MAADGWPEMKPLLFLLALLVWTTLAVFADTDVTGIWKVGAVPGEPAPKTVGSMILDLKVNGKVITGTAIIGRWPGEAPISDARVITSRLRPRDILVQRRAYRRAN